jgi:hypothetical protein
LGGVGGNDVVNDEGASLTSRDVKGAHCRSIFDSEKWGSRDGNLYGRRVVNAGCVVLDRDLDGASRAGFTKICFGDGLA